MILFSQRRGSVSSLTSFNIIYSEKSSHNRRTTIAYLDVEKHFFLVHG